MFKDIKSLENFGPYKKFIWPNVPEMRPFARFNLFYGWNYSGKTTLSRVFRCLEIGALEEWCKGAAFRLTRSDGSTLASDSLQPDSTIRVFNSDYIKRSLRWDRPHEGADPVLLVGEENLVAQQRIDAINLELPPLESERRTKDEGAVAMDRALNQKLTGEAARIKRTWLADRSEAFERPRLVSLLGDLGKDHETSRLPPEQHAREAAKFVAQIRTGIAPIAEPKLLGGLKLVNDDYLEKTPVGRVIPDLQANPPVNLWAKQGWELHRHAPDEVCAFCGNKLTADRIQLLDDHFSRAYQEQLTELIATKESYLRGKAELERARTLPFNAGNFYSHLAERAAKAIEEYEAFVDAELKLLEAAVAAISAKEANLFNKVASPIKSTVDFQSSVNALNAVVAEHNDFGENIAKLKESSRQLLIRHAASEAATAVELATTQEKITAAKASAAAARETIGRLERERAELTRMLDDTAKGAEAMNEYLRIYFGTSDLVVAANAAKRLEVRRGNEVALHLSEGEKTAISFAHFLVSLEERGAKIEQATIFIDDPISSLDSNHLFGVFALIQGRLEAAKQLFVSTHSYEFFDLLLRWRTKNGNVRQDSATYLLRKADIDGRTQCEIGPLPAQLSKFRSEYVYLFSLVHRAKENPMQSVELLTLPNVMRRFLEAFMHFKYLGLDTQEKWSRCFGDSAERVRKFIHQGSHEVAMRSFTIPDRQEATLVAKEVVAMVERMDKTHFDGLKSAIAP